MTEDEQATLLRLVGWLWESSKDHYTEIETCDLEGALLKAGIVSEEFATVADTETDLAQDWDVQVGDPMFRLTPLGKRCQDAYSATQGDVVVKADG